jgi:sugar (pentulose or hexulose) kinase
VAPSFLIGIDVGTTAVKAILIDAAGNRLADFQRPVPMSRPSPGCAEQNPDHWAEAVLAVLTLFASRVDLSGLAAIGICSQVNTHAFVGSDRGALMPAITCHDTRYTPEAEALDAQVSRSEDGLVRRSGADRREPRAVPDGIRGPGSSRCLCQDTRVPSNMAGGGNNARYRRRAPLP